MTRWPLDSIIMRWILPHAMRKPDFIIGGEDRPYLLRWYLLGGKWEERDGKKRWVPRKFLGMRPYLHCFRRSDDDRALHDHPAASLSVALLGEAVEHTIAAGGIHQRRVIKAGQWRVRSARFAHRIEIADGTEFWTLFVFFPNVREWGFHCRRGWVHWKQFTADNDPGAIGRGCGEYS